MKELENELLVAQKRVEVAEESLIEKEVRKFTAL